MKQVETRLSKNIRGFFNKKDPSFYGVNAAFKNVANDTKNMKLANENVVLGYLKTLKKYALLEQFDEPIEALAKRLAESNFGYGGDPAKEKSIENSWGPSTEKPSGSIDSLGGMNAFIENNRAV